MSMMKWDDTLSIGIDLIDEQHKTWIGKLNDVSDALTSSLGSGHIIQTLGFLCDYTVYHFSSEEKHMVAHRYPELQEHRAKHEDLKKTLDNLLDDFNEEGATPRLAEAIDTFLSNWLIRHIQDVDQRFGAFLKEKGITLESES